jgi:hypothetical protein
MDSPERQSVRRALDSLKPYLEAFLAQHNVRVEAAVRGPSSAGPDIQALLKASVAHWESRLQAVLPNVARSYIHELRDVRNRWAHEEPFTADEAARAADTVRVLGVLIGAPASKVETPASSPGGSSVKPALKVRSAGRRESQREVMARIFAAVDGDHELAVREYAAAERRGEVVRKSNRYGIDAATYARALLNDGRKKGWL